jgi:hypothetical protein
MDFTTISIKEVTIYNPAGVTDYKKNEINSIVYVAFAVLVVIPFIIWKFRIKTFCDTNELNELQDRVVHSSAIERDDHYFCDVESDNDEEFIDTHDNNFEIQWRSVEEYKDGNVTTKKFPFFASIQTWTTNRIELYKSNTLAVNESIDSSSKFFEDTK